MEDHISTIYKRGFNHGYILSEYEPKLLKQILGVNVDNEYMQAMAEGSRQQEKEQLIEQMNRDLDRGQGKGRGM